MRHMTPVIAHALCDLTRKLAGRGEGKDAGAAFGRVLVLAENMGEGRQRQMCIRDRSLSARIKGSASSSFSKVFMVGVRETGGARHGQS